MSKTLDIYHHAHNDGVTIVPPGGGDIEGHGYTLEGSFGEVLYEDGRTAVDIPDDKHFHIEEDNVPEHYVIRQEDHPQGPQEYQFDYSDNYTFSEKVEVAGIPDTDRAYEVFRYLPHVTLVMEWDGESDKAEVTGVVINGTRHDIDEGEGE